MEEWVLAGGRYSTKFYGGRLRPPVVRQKKYPFHIPRLEFCIPFSCCKFIVFLQTEITDFPTRRGGGGATSHTFSLNEIQTMFSQLSKRIDQRVLRRNKIMAVEGWTVSHHYILVIGKFIVFMSLFRHSVRYALSCIQFSFAEFRMCNIWLIRTTEELSYWVVFCCKPKES